MENEKDQQLATKKDLLELRQANQKDLEQVRLVLKKDLKELKQANKNDLLDLKQANRKDLVELRQATQKDLVELRREMASKKDLEHAHLELKGDILFLHGKFLEHDERFDRMEGKLDKTIHIVQQMCDKVLKVHDRFEVESAAIKGNYQHLEGRLTKVEQIVFPQS